MINRSEIIDILDNNKEKIKRDNFDLNLIKENLEKVLQKLNLAECVSDSRFIPYGRMELLKNDLEEKLKDKNYLDAYFNITDYLSDSRISLNNSPKIVDMNKEYYNENIICSEEKNILIEMIKNYLLSIKDEDMIYSINNEFTQEKLKLMEVDANNIFNEIIKLDKDSEFCIGQFFRDTNLTINEMFYINMRVLEMCKGNNIILVEKMPDADIGLPWVCPWIKK